MKIGILTYHYALNFGAFLQGFALQQYLTSKGHKVEFVNYENDTVNLSYKLFRFSVYNKRKPQRFLERLLDDIYKIYAFQL